MICALAADTHHLRVVGIEGLFVQGEFLRPQRVVQLDHLRKLQAGINKMVREQSTTGEARQKSNVGPTYHPRFAAEVVDGIKGVDTRDPAEMKADHKVPEVLAGDHAVGVLTDEDKVRLEGPAGRQTRRLKSGYIAQRGTWNCVLRACYCVSITIMEFTLITLDGIEFGLGPLKWQQLVRGLILGHRINLVHRGLVFIIKGSNGCQVEDMGEKKKKHLTKKSFWNV